VLHFLVLSNGGTTCQLDLNSRRLSGICVSQHPVYNRKLHQMLPASKLPMGSLADPERGLTPASVDCVSVVLVCITVFLEISVTGVCPYLRSRWQSGSCVMRVRLFVRLIAPVWCNGVCMVYGAVFCPISSQLLVFIFT